MGGGAPDGDGPGLGPLPASAFWAPRFSDATADVAACTSKKPDRARAAIRWSPSEMKVEDTEQALTEAVCSRVREQLARPTPSSPRRSPASSTAGSPPRTWPSATRSTSTGWRSGTSTSRASALPGTPKVRVYNPRFEEHGWQSTHTAVEIVTDDMPFLIDSVSMELNRRGFGVHLIIHPVLGVRRDDDGELLEILPQPPGETPEEGVLAESVIHAEVARQTDPAKLRELELHLERVIGEVRAAVEDWPAMRSQALDVAAEIAALPRRRRARTSRRRSRSSSGSRRTTSPSSATASTTRTARRARASASCAGRGGRGRRAARPRRACSPSRRRTRAPPCTGPSYLDYVGVKRFDADGNVIGERRFLGLYTHTAYRASPTEIPILRRRVAAVLERAALPARQPQREGAARDPRHLPARRAVPDLRRTSCSTWRWGSSTSASASGCGCSRAATRSGASSRCSCSCRATASTRRTGAASRRSCETPPARRASTTRRACPSPCSCASTSWPTCEPGLMPDFDAREVEMMLVAATRSWADDLEEALVEELGEERGGELFRRYADAFPAAYRADWVARSALADIVHIEELPKHDGLGISLYRPLEAGPRMLRAKLFRAGRALMLSDVLPLFENMGVEVADERPYPIVPRDADGVWIYDFGLTYPGAGDLDADGVRESFQDAFVRAWRGEVENDAYNRLVLGAALTWREITVLRAIGKYLRQARITFSDRYVEQALVAHPEIARLLVALFQARFDPRRTDREDAEEVAGADRAGDRRGREPRPGPDPAHVPRRDPGDAAHELLPHGAERARAAPVVQARPLGAALAAAAAPPLRDLRLLAAHRGRAPARRARRARRHPLVGPPRGLPHRGARPDEGADGEERGDRARGREGRVRGEAAAGQARRAARGGRGLLPDLHPRAARPDRRHRRRRGRAAPGDRALRRRRPLPGGGRRQGHRHLLGHRERDRARGGLLARRRVRLGRLDRLRPQEDGHHRARRVGVREAPLPRARPRHPVRGLHGRRHRRHVRRRVRQRDAALAPHPARRRVQPPARVHRPRSGPGAELRGAQAPVRAARVVLGRLRPRGDLGRRRRLRAHREVDPALGGGARRARDRGRGAQAERADPGAPARARGPALERRHRHVREGQLGVARRRRRQGERRGSRERLGAARPGGRRGRQPRRDAGRARGVRARRRAGEHGRDRQLGRRGLLRPRGEHQDPAGRRGRGRATSRRSSATRCSSR